MPMYGQSQYHWSAFRDGGEFGEITFMIQTGMKLDGALGRSENGPRKGRQAQIDGRGIQ